MKHLLSGTAIAAALVVAVPLAANAVPTGPGMPTVGSAQGVELVAGSSPNADQYTSKARKARHHHATRRGSARGSDNIANQLNAQEAARNAGGGMGGAPAPVSGGGMRGAPAPAYGGPRNVYGQPNQTYGIPGAGQPSAAGPLPGAR
jgi:hypothetical protein